jgi:hypothetical protein
MFIEFCKFITNPFGAALILTILLEVVYLLSVSTILIENAIRFFIFAYIVSAIVIYINNHYLLNNFKPEPVENITFEDFNQKIIEAKEIKE